MNSRLHGVSDLLALASGLSTITAWQEQLDWSLRILAALIAIAAGSVALYQRLKKPKDSPTE